MAVSFDIMLLGSIGHARLHFDEEKRCDDETEKNQLSSLPRCVVAFFKATLSSAVAR